MGMEIKVNTMEELCDLMCDNKVPKQKEYEYCLRCGRRLKSPETRAKGYGVICERKLKKPCKIRLF